MGNLALVFCRKGSHCIWGRLYVIPAREGEMEAEMGRMWALSHGSESYDIFESIFAVSRANGSSLLHKPRPKCNSKHILTHMDLLNYIACTLMNLS